MEKNKTAMTHLIEKILRMPESNIKFFLKQIGPSYLESEKEQIIDAHGVKSRGGFRSNGEFFQETKTGEEYYNETYANDTTKGLPEEDSKRRAWHY